MRGLITDESREFGLDVRARLLEEVFKALHDGCIAFDGDARLMTPALGTACHEADQGRRRAPDVGIGRHRVPERQTQAFSMRSKVQPYQRTTLTVECDGKGTTLQPLQERTRGGRCLNLPIDQQLERQQGRCDEHQ